MDFSKKFGALGGEGVWVAFPEEGVDPADLTQVKLIVPGTRASMMNNMGALKEDELQRMLRGIEDAANDEPEELTVADRFDKEARVISSSIIDWKNVKDDGKDLPYAKKTVVQYCRNYPEFRFWVQEELVKLEMAEVEKKATAELIKKK